MTTTMPIEILNIVTKRIFSCLVELTPRVANREPHASICNVSGHTISWCCQAGGLLGIENKANKFQTKIKSFFRFIYQKNKTDKW